MYYTEYFRETTTVEVQQSFTKWLEDMDSKIKIISHSIACDSFGSGAWVISVIYEEIH